LIVQLHPSSPAPDELDNFLFKQLEIFQVVLNDFEYFFGVYFPVKMDQAVAELRHHDQPLAEILVDDAYIFQAYNYVRIGLGGIERFLKLIERKDAIAYVQAAFNG
jgi:hypothetical protein